MSNPPKQKGTSGEREVVDRGKGFNLDIYRTPPGAPYDAIVRGSTGRRIKALATRPDYGQWLVSIPIEDFYHLLAEHGDGALIEVKRYKKFAHHTLYEGKFG